MCKTGSIRVREGLIKDSEQIRNAYETLLSYRTYPGGVEWIMDDSCGMVQTEEKADEVIRYLKEKFKEQLKYSGEEPLNCMHGKIFFNKLARLELESDQEKQALTGIANILGVAPGNVLMKLSHG